MTGTGSGRPGSVAADGRRPGWFGGRDAATLLPKVLLAFVMVLAVAALITLAVETGIARQQLADRALELSNERGEALRRRIQLEGASTRQQLLTLYQQLRLDADTDHQRERRMLETMALTRVSGSGAEVGAIIDLARGRVVSALPGRSALADPGPLTLDRLGRTPESSTRVVPTRDGGHALVHVQTVGRLGGEPSLLAVGYPLDEARARHLRDDLGVADVEIVIGGAVVASTSSSAVGPPAGDPTVRSETQPTDDGRLVRYVAMGAQRPWDTPTAIGLLSDDPLAGLDRALTRTRVLTLLLVLAVGAIMAFAAARVLTRPIIELTATASAIAEGDLERSFEVPRRRDELGTLARALEAMRRELRSQLLVIADQAAALQEAARRIVGAQDQERRRAAQDLHDGLQHQLVVLRMQVGAARARLAVDPSSAPEVTDALAESVEQVLVELRSTGHELFPSILRDRGLTAALHSLAARCEARVDVGADPDPLPRLEEDVEVGAYFMIAEAVTNVLRHADADVITVAVSLDENRLRIEVADDGRGFDVGRSSGGGTSHLADRARALGGRLHIRSAPGRGTTVEAVLPVLVDRSIGVALQEEEHGRDTSVELDLLGEAELAEDRARVLLDGSLGDGQLPGDRGIPPT